MPKYNGYVLPVEPERDKGLFPHAIIQRIKYETGGFIAHFIYCTEPFYLDWTNKLVTYPDTATAYRCTYISSDKEFVWGSPITSASLNKSTDPNTVIWTDTDLYADNGMFFLGASYPSEVMKKWAGEKVYMEGFAMGLAGAPAPFSPSPWRNYGGYKAPACPYFDVSAYPYLVMQRMELKQGSGDYLYQLDAFSKPISDPEYWGETSVTPYDFRWLCKNPGRLLTALWWENTEPKWWSVAYNGPVSAATGKPVEEWEVMNDTLIWTNHDVYDPEGNLFMAAGEILPWKEAE